MLPLSAASLLIKEASGAAGETRTPTGFNPLAPQASASTNSATAATGPGELPKMVIECQRSMKVVEPFVILPKMTAILI